jgi:hypothetical protein
LSGEGRNPRRTHGEFADLGQCLWRRLMELEIGGLTGAALGEKNVDRLVQRNGFSDRDWETRARSVEAARLGRRHHPKRGRNHPPRRRDPARTE